MNERLKPFTGLLWSGLQAWNFETNSGLDSKLESLKGLLWSGLNPGGRCGPTVQLQAAGGLRGLSFTPALEFEFHLHELSFAPCVMLVLSIVAPCVRRNWCVELKIENAPC